MDSIIKFESKVDDGFACTCNLARARKSFVIGLFDAVHAFSLGIELKPALYFAEAVL